MCVEVGLPLVHPRIRLGVCGVTVTSIIFSVGVVNIAMDTSKLVYR